MSVNEPNSPAPFKRPSKSKVRLEPKYLMQRFLSSFDKWKASRSWGVVAFGILPILVLMFVFGVIIWGNTVASANIVKDYLEAAEAVAPVKEDGTGANEELQDTPDDSNAASQANKNEANKAKEREELGNYAFKLYRRVLEQEANNKRALYYVAFQMSQRNDLPTARSMMNQLAPDDTEGYPAAHAWRAYDILRTAAMTQKQPDMKVLEHHLSLAAKWGGTSAELLAQRARMLEAEGKVNQALAMYSLAADRKADFKLLLAEAFRRHQQPSRMQQAIDNAITYFSRNFNTEQESLDDRLKVAQAHLIVGDVSKAVNILEVGLRDRGKRADYQRAISQVLHAAYVKTAQINASTFSANLVLLDRAIEVDPTNPIFQQEIGRLTMIFGQPESLEDSINSLNQQLGSATAPTLSHLLLANLNFLKGSMNDAFMHWEIALRINPNVATALRSYGLALSLQQTPDFEKALSLIDRGLSITNDSAEMLDAKGDVLVRMGKLPEAAKLYESATLKIQPMASLLVRKKLVAAYTELGETDKLNREQKILELIEKRAAEIRAAQAAAASPSAPATTPNPDVVDPSTTRPTAPEEKKVDEDLESLIKGLGE